MQVLVRCRPLLEEQCSEASRLQIYGTEEGPEKVTLRLDATHAVLDPLSRPRGRLEPRNFRCNSFCDEGSSQEDVFAHCAPIIDRVMEGYNGTIFCFGVTGSGKTYTMSGPPQDKRRRQEQPAVPVEAQGIVQRAATRIFEFIRDRGEQGEIFSVESSFLEIYSGDGMRETLVDLLADGKDAEHKLEMKRDPTNDQSFVCSGLTSVPIRSPDDLFEVLALGRRRCTYMETSRNCLSSRSHCIFAVTVESLGEQESGNLVRRGKLVLVDLAGSESLKKVSAASEANEELRRRQAIGINRVLSNLGAVVNNLNTGFQNCAGYRNSALTMLLRDCLGGSARALLIANISPEAAWCSETFTTLTFAQQMMQVRNVEKPVLIEGSQSVLMQMRLRHLECVQRLQEQQQAAPDPEEGEDWQKIQKEVDELNKRLLTRNSATETLAQMQQEQNRKIEQLRVEVTQAMAEQFASIQEQSAKDLEGLREAIQAAAREGGAQMEQRQTDLLEAQLSNHQSDINESVAVRRAAETDVAQIRVQVAAAEERVLLLQELQQDVARERGDLESERRALRQQADEQYRKVTDIECEKEKYRAEGAVLRDEVDRLHTLSTTDQVTASEDRQAWRGREAELQALATATRAQLEVHGCQAELRHEAALQHHGRVEALRAQITRLEAESTVQAKELESMQKEQVSLQEDLRLRRLQEDRFRRGVEEEVNQYEEDIEEAQHRADELMAMLAEVQSSIMLATTRPARPPSNAGTPSR